VLKNQIRLGKLFGIPIHIDVSWLLIFVWVTWSLAGSYFPQRYPTWAGWLYWAVGVITSLLFFISVLLHELGHSVVARAQGTPVRDITLFLFGGVSEIAEEPTSPQQEFRMAIVGPLVSLLLAGLYGGLYLLTRSLSQAVAALCLFLATMNLSLGLFNLIPGFPLDGGRVLRAILWGARRDLAWATRWASRVGQAAAYLFILVGIVRAFGGDWVGGLWMAFIGLFLDNAARSSYLQLTLHKLLDGHIVREVMTQDCILLPPQLTLDVLVDQYMVAAGKRCFTVGTRDKLVGLLTIHNVGRIPKDAWPNTHVSAITTPLDQVRTVGPETPLWHALEEMTAAGVNQLPVMENGDMVGMLTREHLLTYIRNRSALGV
jgi:Zn-dependent protease/CBS domain-containing protein